MSKNLQTVSINTVVVTQDARGHVIPTIVNFFDTRAEVRTIEGITAAQAEGGQVREYNSGLSFRMRYTRNTDTMSRNLVNYSIDYKGVNFRLNSATVFSDRNWIEFKADNSGATVV